MSRLIVLSDTHNQHDKINVPEGDFLIYVGDATLQSSVTEITSFANWFNHQPHKHKILVWGNHDYSANTYFHVFKPLFSNVHVLQDNGVELEGLKFWGLDYPTKTAIDKIPSNIDILLSHYPALGICDEIPPHSKYNPTPIAEHLGSTLTLDLLNNKKPKYFFFGHVHEGYGLEEYNTVRCFNCSQLDEYYHLVNKPWVIDL